jgi:hypothetical protein
MPAGAKSEDANGKPSGKQSVGLLRRRHVRVEQIIYIGRESNRARRNRSRRNSLTRECLHRISRPLTRRVADQNPVEALMRFSDRSRSMLLRTMAGRSRPRRRNQELLKSILHRLGVI